MEPFARPSATHSTQPFTPQQLADFRREPLLLRRLQSFCHGAVVSGNGGDGGRGAVEPTPRPENGLLGKVAGITFGERDTAIVYIDGSRYPLEMAIESLLTQFAEREGE